MKVVILSDMHVPGQASQLPDEFRERVREADAVVYAGDFGSKDALANVRELAPTLTAVHGNADPGDIDLPAVASVEVGGMTFVVTHGDVNLVEQAVFSSQGVVYDREDWLDAIADVTRQRADEPRVGIGGHTHEVEDAVHEGVRVLNPGTATGINQDDATMMTVEVAEGNLDVTVHTS